MEVYNTPKSELGEVIKPKREKLGKILSWLSIGSLWPLFGVVKAINQLILGVRSITLFGDPDPELLDAVIIRSFEIILLNIVVSIPSLACIFLVLFISTYRSKMFFWLWVISAIILFLSIPVGTILGVILGITLVVKRKEFHENA